MVGRKFIINVYITEKEWVIIIVTFLSYDPRKIIPNWIQLVEWKEIIKSRHQWNKKCKNNTKSLLSQMLVFEEVNKIDETLGRLTLKKKTELNQITSTRNEGADIPIGSADVKREMLCQYIRQVRKKCAWKTKQSKLIQDEIKNLNAL